MPEIDQPSPSAEPPSRPVVDLRARVAAHGVMEQVLARQHRTEGTRPLDDHLRCDLDPEAAGWYSGALGEIRVGLMLATLDPCWTVVHSIPVGDRGSDLDHLVIGPAGVFVINTKRHFGKRVWAAGHGLRVENQQVPYLRNLELEMSRTDDALKKASGLAVDAVGIVAVVDAASVTVTAAPIVLHREAHVLDADRLVQFLRARRRVLSDDQVARIVAAALLPETWTTAPQPAAEGDLLRLEFEALRVRVEAGTRSRDIRTTAVQSRHSQPGVPAGSPRPTRKARRARSSRAWLKLLGAAGAVAVGGLLLQNGLSQLSRPPAAPLFASAADEQAALVQHAGTAAMLIDQHSAAGTRPELLTLTPGTSILRTSQGTAIVDLPDGTGASYVPSTDLTSYTLTLTGPQYGTTVSVSPEAGVVPGKE